jgi:hypothetical protein
MGVGGAEAVVQVALALLVVVVLVRRALGMELVVGVLVRGLGAVQGVVMVHMVDMAVAVPVGMAVAVAVGVRMAVHGAVGVDVLVRMLVRVLVDVFVDVFVDMTMDVGMVMLVGMGGVVPLDAGLALAATADIAHISISRKLGSSSRTPRTPLRDPINRIGVPHSTSRSRTRISMPPVGCTW